MLNKTYDKIKKIIKNNLGFIITLFILFLLFYIELPYYINAPGSLINLKDKTNIENKLSGSYNMTYVTEYKANILNYVLSYFIPNWDLEKKAEVILSNETEEDISNRSHLLLKEGNQVAIINAYRLANKEINIKNSTNYVTYVDELANSTLNVGDEIKMFDDIEVSDLTDIRKIINNKNYGDIVKIETQDGIKSATIINFENEKKIGISISTIYELETDIEFKFKNNESGSSGGLMTTLYIYNSLIDEDLTKGKIVSGTGSIDINGNIGEIGGVKYKLIGAVKEKADIFFVPYENYEEAIKVKKENNYDIDIVLVNTLEDAVNYLKDN